MREKAPFKNQRPMQTYRLVTSTMHRSLQRIKRAHNRVAARFKMAHGQCRNPRLAHQNGCLLEAACKDLAEIQ